MFELFVLVKKCVGYIEADTAEEAMEHQDLEFNDIIWMNAELRV